MGGVHPNEYNKHVIKGRSKTARVEVQKKYIFQGKPVGVGAFSHVYPAVSALNPAVRVAIKAINKAWMTRSQIKSFHREIEILATLNHPNVIRYIESYEDSQYLFIVMELFHGTTLANRVRHKRFTEYGAAVVMHQLLSAIEYCHSKNVAHRDIKTDNILIDDAGHITLIDFGLSKNYSKKENLKTCAGTPMFMAPEILKEIYTPK